MSLKNLGIGFDNFNEKGYRYRDKAPHIRYYFDSLPDNLTENAWYLLMMIAEIMNEDNVLVYRVKRKSKFSSIIYKPMDKYDIMERTRFRFGVNKFETAWKHLKKHCIKKIQYHDYLVWAVNPAVVSKTKYIPFWLYDEFKEYLDPHLSASTINKLKQKVLELYYE